MPHRSFSLTLPIVVSALGAISGALLGGAWWWLHYLCKPLATALLLLMAARAAAPMGPRYRGLICAGLLLSLAGDVFLMLPTGTPPFDPFVAGLLAFLLAHLCYCTAFSKGSTWPARVLMLLIYGAVAVGNLVWLLPHVPAALRSAVLAYVAVLTTMAALAGARAWSLRGDPLAQPARIAAIGGGVFVLSDCLLAWDKFGDGIPHSVLWVLASYYAAQWCIARSVQAALPAMAD